MGKVSAISRQRSAFLFVLLCVCASAFGVADSNLVVHYKFDDAADSNVVIDEKGNNGTSVRNTSLMHVAGKVGGALEFNGTSDYVLIPSSTVFDFGTTDFSICFEMKLDGLNIPVNQYILVRSPDAYRQILVFTSAYNELTVELNSTQYDSWGYSAPLTEAMVGQWVFVVVVKTSSGVQTYFNNSPAIMREGFKDGNPNLVQPNTPICIGSYNPIEGYFNGSIDNVMIFNKALSAAEVLQLYNEANSAVADSNSIGRLDDRRSRNRY